jgi:chromosome segregation ATPase
MRTRVNLLVLTAAAMFSSGALADESEADRLREALRSATMQTRALEDQRTQLQAKIAQAERDKAAARAEVDAAKAQVKKIEKEHREAVEEFNQRLSERDQTLEKWKAAYEEAADVARTKDAERAKFESESNTYKASTKNCVAKNGVLVKEGHEMVQRYKAVTVGDILVAHEPVLQLRRVEIENQTQDADDKFLDQKVNP